MRVHLLIVLLATLTLITCDDESVTSNINNTNNTNATNENNGNNNNTALVPTYTCEGAQIHVSPTGDDGGVGTEEAPFATLERAGEEARILIAAGTVGVKVCIRGGRYELLAPLNFGSEDSGTLEHPVTWVGHPGERVILSGGALIAPGEIMALSDQDPNFTRFVVAARESIKSVDLTAAGITDLGELRRRGYRARSNPSALELVINDEMLHLARWPNKGQYDSPPADYPASVSGDIFGPGTQFTYMGTVATGNADDGYANYHANVGGSDYYLYHCTWEWGGATHRYWFVSGADPTVDANCWPSEVTSWAASGEEAIPILGPLGGGSVESLTALNGPEDEAQGGFVRIPEVISETRFTLPGERHTTWGENTLFIQGLLGNYWADDTIPVTLTGDQVELAEEASYGVVARQPFFVMNVMEELDDPGEYYVDHERGVLYFIPRGDVGAATVEVTLTESPLITMDGASHIHFSGLTLQSTRAGLMTVSDSTDILLVDMVLQNSGTAGLTMEGSGNGVARTSIRGTGDLGLQLRCGDRATLQPGGCFLADSQISGFGRWNRTYAPAVRLEGCGNEVVHNTLHFAPHAAILFSGNEHRIAYNEIHDVVAEANDAGAIYTGRDFGYRGNIIEYNFIHHIDSLFGGSHAVYLDDAVSGITVRSNIIYAINGLATQSGGGRDNIFEFNVIVDVRAGAHATDRRAQVKNNDSWSGDNPDSWNLLGRLQMVFESYNHGAALNHRAEPWASRYPELAVVPNNYSDIEGSHWLDPEGSLFARNLVWRCETLFREGTWGGEGALERYADISGNVQGEDPRFQDEEGGDFTLQSTSPAYDIPGFPVIDFNAIGPRQ